jgi:hypothetical protein
LSLHPIVVLENLACQPAITSSNGSRAQPRIRRRQYTMVRGDLQT